MEKYFGMLKQSPLFAGISLEDMPRLMEALDGRVKNFEREEVILAEGSPATHMGLVLEGAVQIARSDYYGNRSLLARIEKGDIFAESFTCAGVRTMPVEAVAAEDSRVLLLAAGSITAGSAHAADLQERLIFNLLRISASKNLLMNRKIEIISKRSTRGKLMAYLLMNAKDKGSSFSIPYDRQELADYLEVDRSGLSAEIGKLRREGIIECKKNQFKLL